MAISNLDEYKNYVHDQVAILTQFMEKYGRGDFSERAPLPKEENEFAELFAALNLMADHMQESVQEKQQTILELEETREALEENKDKLHYIFEASNIGKSITYPSGEVHINDAFAEMLGYTREELKEKTWAELTYPEDIKDSQEKIDPLLKGEKDQVRFNKRYLHKDGSIVWANVSTRIRRDSKNQPEYFITTLVDISDLKEAEKAQELHSQALAERVKELQCLYKVGEVTRESESLEAMFEAVAALLPSGWRYSDLARGNIAFDGKSYASKKFEPTPWKLSSDIIVNEEWRGTVEVYYREERPELDEGPFLQEERDLLNSIANILSKTVEGKELEEELSKKEQGYRDIVDNTNELITVVDGKGNLIFVNSVAEKIWGKSPEDCIGKPAFEMIHPEDRDYTRKEFSKWIAEQDEIIKFENRQINEKTGEVFTLDWIIKCEYEEDGTPRKITSMARDITEQQQVKQALLESERRFRTMFEFAPFGVAILDTEGHPLETNQKIQEMMGYSGEELSEMTFADFTHPDDVEKDWGQYKKLVAGEIEIYSMEKRYYRKTGELLWGSLAVSAVRDEDGNPIYIIGMVDDITMRKMNEKLLIKEKNTLESTIDSIPGVFYQLSPEGEFLQWNRNFTEITGYTDQEMEETKIFDFFTGHDKEKVADNLEEVFKTGYADFEAHFVSKDGKSNPYIFTGTSQEIDDQSYLIGVGLDISELKTAQDQLNVLNRELEVKNKELEQVLYTTSHDLRSPLVNVQGFSKELRSSLQEMEEVLKNENFPQAVQEKLTPILDEEIPEALQFILSSTTKMDQLLSGLLTLSRVGRQKLSISKLDMNRIVKTVVEEFGFHIKEKDIKVIVSDLPPCSGDPEQMNRVFSNLLGNALKFLSPDRSGEIRISGHTKDDKVVYVVEDNGIGMAPTHKNKIFDLFTQLDPQKEGKGMGLSIVKQIVDKHKGDISVTSTVNQGSQFQIILPAK